ncbi:MAG TPA: hypothetical protein VLG40_03375 [Candidatus Saccharimonas sp.]|nr:hypothetical protein [Candidatus Saccharimonas sp.]
MGEYQVKILIVGANASQGMYGQQLLDDSLLSAAAETHVTFYDRKPVALQRRFTNLVKGAEQKRVVFVDTFPSKQRFDVVIIAVSSEQHVPALREVLNKLPELPRLFVLEKPLGVSVEDLQWYRSVGDQLQPLTVVNEPYHFMYSVAELLLLAKAKPLTEVNVWSSKKRRLANEHGGLKVFAIEFPHLHGVASRFADHVLSLPECCVNEYYRDVQGVPNNDGSFARFMFGGVAYTVSQGLGAFVMDRHGTMQAHDDPPRTRKIRLNYADGSYVELDTEPAFPSHNSRGAGGELYFYDAHNQVERTKTIPDDPRRFFVEFIVRRALEPRTPLLDGVKLLDSLDRNRALIELRSAAAEVIGRRIPSA